MRIRCGAIEIDVQSQEVWQGGVRLPAAPRVADVLLYLIQNPNRTITKEELFEKIWQGRPVEDGAISRVIWDVRALLGDQGKQIVVNVPRRGYRFEPVQALMAFTTDASAELVRVQLFQVGRNLDEMLFAQAQASSNGE